MRSRIRTVKSVDNVKLRMPRLMWNITESVRHRRTCSGADKESHRVEFLESPELSWKGETTFRYLASPSEFRSGQQGGDRYVYLQDAVTLIILTDSQNGVFTGGNVVLARGTENEDGGNCKGEIGPRLDFGC